jgi:hypothetical protein
VVSVLSLSLRFLLKLETAWVWWLRCGLGGLRRDGYGVGLVVTAWWTPAFFLGLVVTAWGLVVTAWWFSSRDPRLQNFFFFFSQQHHLKPPATTRRDPRLFSQIWTHRGQPPPRRDPRRGSLLRSVQTEASHCNAAKHEPRWWSLSDLHGGFCSLLRSVQIWLLRFGSFGC